MGRIFGKTILTLCCTLLLAATVQAKTLKEVYLKDGGIIECQKVWQANGKVMVLVNRDTLLNLTKADVDLKKTFAKKKAKAVKEAKHRKKAASHLAAAKPQEVSPPPAEPAVAPPAKQKPEAAKQAPAAAKPAAKEVKPTANQAAPPPAKAPEAVKQAVQQAATSAKKGAAEVAVTTPGEPRPALPLAKPVAPPEEQKSLLSGNMTNIGLGALLVLLIIGYVIYKKKQG